MAKLSRPRHGSLQFWPRSRAAKIIPSVNWKTVSGNGVLGFIGYKAGMATAVVKDLTDKSMTAGKKMIIPVTIIETPAMRVFSVRLYKHGHAVKDIIVSIDKELKKIVRLPKAVHTFDSLPEYDDVRILVYTLAKETRIKKTPDMIEVAIGAPDKLAFAKSLVGKDLSAKDVLTFPLADARGVTKGFGFTGTIPRYGLTLKAHKSEKGVRRPGSLGPWHPARVTFLAPQAGQFGMFSRIIFNLPIVSVSNATERKVHSGTGLKHYGPVNGAYVLVKGSVQGPVKRPILLTPATRPTKKMAKKKYQLLEVSA